MNFSRFLKFQKVFACLLHDGQNPREEEEDDCICVCYTPQSKPYSVEKSLQDPKMNADIRVGET
jgi:hypothetical protein